MASTAQNRRLLPSLLGALGVVLWASETALITFTTAIPPLQTVALAFAFAAALSPLVWWITGTHPLAAFRQPLRVWVVTVVSLVGYHACIYYATQKAPPAAAALLQGTTPLMIVIGSALLPGERLRFSHVAGACLGLCGILLLVEGGGEAAQTSDPVFYLALIGIAAALWGLYSLISRSFGDVPTSALGVFYAASALASWIGHAALETWVTPEPFQWGAIAALGLLPMGLALYLWDYGVKRGDIQALGAFSYVEPFVGAVLVVILGQGSLSWTLFWAGCLVIGGAGLASLEVWRKPRPVAAFPAVAAEGSSAFLEEPAPDTVDAARGDLRRATGELAVQAGEAVERIRASRRSDPAEVLAFLPAFKRALLLWERVALAGGTPPGNRAPGSPAPPDRSIAPPVRRIGDENRPGANEPALRGRRAR